MFLTLVSERRTYIHPSLQSISTSSYVDLKTIIAVKLELQKANPATNKHSIIGLFWIFSSNFLMGKWICYSKIRTLNLHYINQIPITQYSIYVQYKGTFQHSKRPRVKTNLKIVKCIFYSLDPEGLSVCTWNLVL